MLSVTDRAQTKLQDILEHHGYSERLVRVSVIRGPHGCVHGWSLGIADTISADDTVVQAGELRVLVEADLVLLLQEANIDYMESPLGIGFVIDAPHAQDGHGHEHQCSTRK